MQKRHFEMETDGFYGAYWKCKTDSDCAMIAMIGDDSEDYLARTSVKWLHKLGVNVMTMSPAKKDYGHHNYPLERIEKAISWLKTHGNRKIGIVGASTTGTLALTAASYFEDLTLTIGLTPSDFIWQGFLKGKKAVRYPGFESRLTGAEVLAVPVVTDGHITTSRGMGTAIAFALELTKRLKDEETAKQVGRSIIYNV